LRSEQKAEDVEIEHPVKTRLGHVGQRSEFVDAGVIDEDIEAAIGGARLGEESIDVGFFGDVRMTAIALPPAALILATTSSAPRGWRNS